eukprot:Polyplicarium_translucidae@DN5159_c0_g1_i2.p1
MDGDQQLVLALRPTVRLEARDICLFSSRDAPRSPCGAVEDHSESFARTAAREPVRWTLSVERAEGALTRECAYWGREEETSNTGNARMLASESLSQFSAVHEQHPEPCCSIEHFLDPVDAKITVGLGRGGVGTAIALRVDDPLRVRMACPK